MKTSLRKMALSLSAMCFALASSGAMAAAPNEAANPSKIVNGAGTVPKPLAPPPPPAAANPAPAAETPPLVEKQENKQEAAEAKAEEPKKVVKKKKRRRKKRAPVVTLKDRDEVISFQRRHGIEPTGVVGKKTVRELKKVNANKVNSKEERKLREKVYDGSLDQNTPAVLPKKDRMKIIPSRFVNIEVEETGAGTDKRYTINFNGETLYYVNGQPSIIGISKTFDMGPQEAVILTTYNPTNVSGCLYKNHILVLDQLGTKLLDINNCTREYEAQMAGASLIIEFHEPGISRAMPAMWRLDGLTLTQL